LRGVTAPVLEVLLPAVASNTTLSFRLGVSDGRHPTQNASVVVAVHTPGPPPPALFRYDVGRPGTTQIVFQFLEPQEGMSYKWDFGDGETSSDRDPVHLFPAGGTYPVTVTATDRGGTESSSASRVDVQSVAAPVTLPPASATFSWWMAFVPFAVIAGVAALVVFVRSRR
ncbi:MAG: PKD domain-containing protein, partial [Thermoplasmatota archaeon]